MDRGTGLAAFLCAAMLFFAAVGIFVWNHIHTLRIFRGMEDMLEAAFRGDFSESRYDESRMSALEVRMCQYLKEQEGQRRRLGRELAMLQSIGMTGKQLKKMLICEGCAYSVIAFLAALLLNLLMHALILKQLEHLLWFFLARFIWYPAFGMLAVFLVMGTLIPILAYRSVERMSIVERLRMGE